MIGGVNQKFMRAKNNHKIHSYGGATTQDMPDLLRVGMRRNPDAVILLHSGTNDITRTDIDTLADIEKSITFIQKEKPDTNVAVSLVVLRNDKHRDKNPKIKDLNNRIKTFCQQRCIGVIEHPDFSMECAGGCIPTGREVLYSHRT